MQKKTERDASDVKNKFNKLGFIGHFQSKYSFFENEVPSGNLTWLLKIAIYS
jgi:hypothetical protein